MGGARREASIGEGFGLGLPTSGKTSAVSIGWLGAIDITAQLSNSDTSAKLDFADPNLEVAVVALAGIGSERRRFVTDFRRLIDAGTFGQCCPRLLVADQGVHRATGNWAIEVLTGEGELPEELGTCAAAMSSVRLVTPGTWQWCEGGRFPRDARDRDERGCAFIAR